MAIIKNPWFGRGHVENLRPEIRDIGPEIGELLTNMILDVTAAQIKGLLTLPEGFEPEGVRIVATARSPRRMEATGDYPWQVQERFTHVGK